VLAGPAAPFIDGAETGESVVHHWRASDHLEQSFRAGQWFMYDRGHLVGVIQLGRINRRGGFRGLTPDDVEDDRRTLG
jgi:hypothetical protein